LGRDSRLKGDRLDGRRQHRGHLEATMAEAAMHTESRRRFRAAWKAAGGEVKDIWRTGEERYRHPLYARPVRANKRRKDVPAKLLSAYNATRRQLAQSVGRP
jgi:hypothetical protein